MIGVPVALCHELVQAKGKRQWDESLGETPNRGSSGCHGDREVTPRNSYQINIVTDWAITVVLVLAISSLAIEHNGLRIPSCGQHRNRQQESLVHTDQTSCSSEELPEKERCVCR